MMKPGIIYIAWLCKLGHGSRNVAAVWFMDCWLHQFFWWVRFLFAELDEDSQWWDSSWLIKCIVCHRLLGWGDGYYKGPKETEMNERKLMDDDNWEEDQQLRRKVLRELQALVCNSEDDVSDNVTDTEWFYLVSMSYSFPQGVGYVLA